MYSTIQREMTSRLPITPEHNINAAYSLVYYLGNNDNEKIICVFVSMYFPPNTFNPQLVEPMDRKPTDTESQVYIKVF